MTKKPGQTDPELTARLEELTSAAALREARLADLAVRNGALDREVQTRFDELAELTRRLVATEAALDDARQGQAAEAEARQRAEDLVQQMQVSTSWRLTAPLRGVMGLLRGRSG